MKFFASPRLLLQICLVSGFSILASVAPTQAATNVWDGGAFPDTNWANGLNWEGDVVPGTGDDLVFPEGVPGRTNQNNLPAGLVINSITLDGAGYFLSGTAPFVLNAGVASTGAGVNTISTPILINGSNCQFSTVSGGTLVLNGNLNLNGQRASFAAGGSIFMFSTITNSGGIAKTGTGTLQMFRASTYDGWTDVREGRLLVLDDLALGTSAGETTVAAGSELQVLSGRKINEHLFLSGNLFSGYAITNVWAGPVTLSAPGGVIQVNSGGALWVEGVIDGAGALTKTQAGDLVLKGDNAYTGPTFVQGGNLFINGSQPASAVDVSAGGALRGIGTCGPVTNGFFGSLIPGLLNSPGILHISGGLTFQSLCETVVRLNGPEPGVGHDQLAVTGEVQFEGSASLTVSPGYAPPVGATFEIIRKDSTNPVVGTFVGLPEGALLVASNTAYRISYVGGDGNDITLTRDSVPSSIRSIAPLTNGFRKIVGIGLPRLRYVIEAAANLNSPIPWTPIGTNASDNGGVYEFIDADSPLYPMRFYRVLSP